MIKFQSNNFCTVSGFSLIELLITITLIALTLTFTVNFQTAQHQKGKYYLSHLEHLLQFAQLQTKLHMDTLTICPAKPGTQNICDKNWNSELLVLSQNNTVLKTLPAPPAPFRLTYRGFPSSRQIKLSSFHSLRHSNGTFTLSSTSQPYSYQLKFNKLGRINIIKNK